MAKTSANKRKSQPVPAKSRYLSKSSKKRKKSNDLYEANDSDPDEDKHAQRYDVSVPAEPATVTACTPCSLCWLFNVIISCVVDLGTP
jgi:hypothetical protein